MTKNASKKMIKQGLMFILIFVLIVLRNRCSFLSPIAGHEDGRDLLSMFFNNRSLRLLIWKYAGYVSFGPKLLAYPASFAPVQWIPFLYVVLSGLVAACTLTTVVLDQSRLAAKSQWERLAIAVILIVMPLGKTHMFTNVTYSQWHMLFMLFMLSLQPAPKAGYRQIFWSISILICTASNPLSILALPLIIRHGVDSKTIAQKAAISVCALNVILYQIWGIQTHPFPRLTVESILFSCRVFLSRVIVEILVGPRITIALEARHKGWVTCLVGAGLLIFWVLFRIHRSKNQDETVDATFKTLCWTELYLWLTALLIVIISTHLRHLNDERLIFLLEPNLQRYIYVPKLMISYLVLSRLVPVIHCRVKRLTIPSLCVATLLFVIYLSLINIVNAFLYRSDAQESRQLAVFLQEVQLNLDRKASGEPYNDRLVLVRDVDWDIRLRID